MSIAKREKVQHRKRLLVARAGGCCERCGKHFHPNVYDFHHYDPALKNFSVGQNNMQRALDTLIEEVDKCFLLCANCHREIHTFNCLTFNKF